MADTSKREVIPSARRLMNSLRDIGYKFPAAVADLVDNSIEARSTVVRVDVVFDAEDSWIRVIDNGTGMTHDQLLEAMRYGSERDYDYDEDLGKYGLGLKTASLSQCRRLSVISRAHKKQKRIHGYSWDVDYINETNAWEVLRIKKPVQDNMVDGHLDTNTGTVVVWEQLDRILRYQEPGGHHARKRLLTMCRELEDHLAMVFHRFLEGAVKGKMHNPEHVVH